MTETLQISSRVCIPDNEIEIKAVRSRGAGGQNVNKVSTAIHLRYDITASTLPDYYKQRLLKLRDRRISRDGVIVIKAQQYRSQEKNRDAALQRLRELIRTVTVQGKKRTVTRPTRRSVEKRLEQKNKRGRVKVLRGRISDRD